MGTNFKTQNFKDGKLITLSSPNKGSKIFYWSYAIFFLISTIAFGYLLIIQWYEVIMATIIASLGIIAFAIAFYRFLNKATESEKLFVNKERLDIINSSILKTNTKSFGISEISNFKFNDKEKYEPHPLKGETFDYLGFQTEQQVIQDLHTEGRISFVYRGKLFRFGKYLASWDFSELEVLLYDLTGNDFRYTDKFEQENFN
jgi:hypothetical protein